MNISIRTAASTLVALSAAARLPAQLPPGFSIEPVVTGLDNAVAMAFAPDGRLFVAERLTGAIRVVEDGQLSSQPWATLSPVIALGSEAGLLGLALHPSFQSNRQLFVQIVENRGGWTSLLQRLQGQGPGGGGGGPPSVTTLASHLANGRHVGGPLAFGRDGMLYVTHGDAALGLPAQSLGSTYGKILRLRDDGSAPIDNPFVNVAGADPGVWTYGHRQPFGLCIHPRNGVPYVSENGGRGGDEINRLIAGGNYGYPFHEGIELTPDPTTEDPLFAASPQPAYAGADFYGGDAWPIDYRGDLFVGDWKFGQLTRLDLDPSGTSVLSSAPFFLSVGPVLDVACGPDGALYILHSPMFRQRGCDRISRIVWDSAPSPSVHLTAVSARAVGGSLTVGVVTSPGARTASWLSFRTLTPALTTPWGTLSVPLDISLPAVTAGADRRAYLPLQLPDDPALIGRTLHAQAASVAGTTIRLTTATRIVL